MRTRDARSSSVRARSISWRRSASSAARRSVMSNSAPSIHSRPPGPCTSWPRSSTQRTWPSARTIRYSTTNALSGSAVAAATERGDALAVARVHDAHQRPLGAGDEVDGRVAGDPLDLVADQLERVAGVPGGAVDRARHVDQQGAHEHVVGALLGGAHAGAGAGEQLAAGERAVQVVVGARVERRVGAAALGRHRDREQPRVAQLDARRAARGRRPAASSPAGSRSTITRSAGSRSSSVERAGGVADGARRVTGGAQPRRHLRLDRADHEHP